MSRGKGCSAAGSSQNIRASPRAGTFCCGKDTGFSSDARKAWQGGARVVPLQRISRFRHGRPACVENTWTSEIALLHMSHCRGCGEGHDLHVDPGAAGDPRRGGSAVRALRRRLLAEKGRARAASRTSSIGRWPRRAGSASPCREEYGGSGLGITEAAVLMQAVAESGAGFSGASAIHMNIFGLHPVVVFGTEEQKQRFLPPLIAGDEKTCFRRDRARCRARYDAAEDPRGAPRRPLRLLRPQDLDLDRAGRGKDADPGAHHADRGGRAAVARDDPVLHRSRPQQGRGARDPEDGPQGRRIRTSCSSTGSKCRSRTASARRARGFTTSCTG